MPKNTAARIAANARYNKEHTTQIKMALNNKTDSDIIEHLQKQENKTGYIKNLIREDMNK